MEVQKSREKAVTKKTTAHKMLMSLKEHTRKDLEIKFRNVHAIVKNNRPISDYKWWNDLDVAKGLQHGITYNNLSSATLFIELNVVEQTDEEDSESE